MGSGGSKKKDGEEDDGDGKCVVSPNMMKLVTLITLLVSDFDIVFTLFSIISYAQANGVFYLFIAVLMFFTLVYIGGCFIAARESEKFLDRFKDKVRLNEINGISMEDLEDALNGRRIFWMGVEYEATKKRKTAIEGLKGATPEATGPEEIDIQMLTIALRESEMAGVSLLKMPGDPHFGAKAVKRATDKLVQAKKVQGAKAGISRSRSRLGGPDPADIPDDVPDPSYKPNPPKTRDQMEGRADENKAVDLDGLGDDDDEDDFAMKQFMEEIKEAQSAGDGNLAKMLTLASIKQLDTYKVDKKLVDKKGKITDPLRALFMICEAKGILHSYHQASRTFSRRIVKWSHSIPFYRLMEFGWQPSVSHTDFAGILNANGLYSFTVGIPQFLFSIAFTSTPPAQRDPSPCELNPSAQCTLVEDFGRPRVQSVIVYSSFAVGFISLLISITNIIVDFPAQLFDIAEKDEESLMFTLQAEHATKTWEDKLAVEVQENVKMMLKMSTQFENNSIPGMEAPGLVIEDVMKLERRAMEKKVAYIEHFLTMSEDEKKVRNDLRDGKRKPKGDDANPDAEFIEEEEAATQPAALPAPTPPPAREPSAPRLPPPREPSIPSIPPPTTERIPSQRIPSQQALPQTDDGAEPPVEPAP